MTVINPTSLPSSVVTDSKAGGATAVDSTGVTAGQALIYDNASGKWKPGTAGVTPNPAWSAEQQGMLGIAVDPATAAASETLAKGYALASRVPLPNQVTIANAWVYCWVAGSGLTAGQCQVGIYDSTGALIGLNSDISGSFGTTGLKTLAVTVQAGKSLTQGGTASSFVRVVWLFTGTTAPGFLTTSTAIDAAINFNLGNFARRGANWGGGALTSLPATTPGGESAYHPYLCGVS